MLGIFSHVNALALLYCMKNKIWTVNKFKNCGSTHSFQNTITCYKLEKIHNKRNVHTYTILVFANHKVGESFRINWIRYFHQVSIEPPTLVKLYFIAFNCPYGVDDDLEGTHFTLQNYWKLIYEKVAMSFPCTRGSSRIRVEFSSAEIRFLTWKFPWNAEILNHS